MPNKVSAEKKERKQQMKGSEVYSSKWTDSEILFDDGDFSAIWGRYDGDAHKVLGLRWNGEEGSIGFPQTSAHPVWFVVPTVLVQGVLENLLSHTLQGGCYYGDENKIRLALKEYLCAVRARSVRLAVALCASSNQGKTSTLNTLIDLLCKDGELLVERPQGADRNTVINYHGLIVGIGTGGDYGDVVNGNFAFLAKYRCDIVFCATRKRSDSHSWTAFSQNTVKQSVRMESVAKTIAPAGASQQAMDAINLQQAKDLIAKYL